MNPFRLFLSFEGRTTRRAFWVGLAILIAASPVSLTLATVEDPLASAITATRALGIVGFAWSLGLLFALAALNIKRLHDRNRTGLFAVLFYGPAVLETAAFFVDGVPQLAQLEEYAVLTRSFLGAVGVWFLIELGFYPGTRGPNKYGADPRGRSSGGARVRA